MKTVSMIIVLLFACEPRVTQWDGVPEDRVCTNEGRSYETCISDGKVYHCIMMHVPEGAHYTLHMLCVRDTVNVETVCPEKL